MPLKVKSLNLKMLAYQENIKNNLQTFESIKWIHQIKKKKKGRTFEIRTKLKYKKKLVYAVLSQTFTSNKYKIKINDIIKS